MYSAYKFAHKFVMAVVCAMFLSVAAFADDTPVAVDQLPAAVKTFVAQKFPAQKILFAEKDSGLFEKTKYEVRLDDGTKVEVYKDGTWNKVENKSKGVPTSFVPKGIADYVKANYAAFPVIKVDKKKYGYEVELSNDLELKFNEQFQLIGMDD